MPSSKAILLAWLLILVWAPLEGAPQAGLAQPDAAAKAATLVASLQHCPPLERVAEFKPGFWRKEAWGPPTDVELHLQKTNLVLYPFNAVLEFSLALSAGAAHPSRAEAQADKQLQPLMVLRNRNTYMLGKSEIVLALTEFKDDKGDWHPRHQDSNRCWDEDVPSSK